MNRTVQCYAFEASVPAARSKTRSFWPSWQSKDCTAQSRVQLEASYCFDADKHACVINVGSDVGRDICRIFGGFATEEFGEGTFTVTRADGAPESDDGEDPGMTPTNGIQALAPGVPTS